MNTMCNYNHNNIYYTKKEITKIVENTEKNIGNDNSTILNLDGNTVKTNLYYDKSDTYSKKEMNKKMGNVFTTQKPLQCGYNKKEIDETANILTDLIESKNKPSLASLEAG